MASIAERYENTEDSPSLGPKRSHGSAWHRKVGDIHLLKLKGSHEEMGHQHGALLRGVIEEGPIPYYQTYVERMLRNSGLGPISPLVWQLLRLTVGRSVRRRLPDYAVQSIRGLAEGSGISLAKLMDGYTMPDSLMWVAARSIELKRRGPALHHRLALGLGCTSAIAWGGATDDGKLLHGRNTDYHGVECWPKTAAVVFHEPDEGQRYVAAGAAGILMGGVTSMNEAGLSLTVHQHMFTDGTRLGGTPIGVVGDRVMRDAETLDDAEAILREHTPIGCWTYLVTDGKNGEMLCFEENPDHQAALRYGRDKEVLGYSNIYLDGALGATEQNLYPSYWRANEGRYVRANELLESGRGTLTPSDIAGILADEGGGSCRIRNAVAMLMTVGSVVFKPEDGIVWVAEGGAPVSQNAYQPFSLETEDFAPDVGPIHSTGTVDVDEREAFDAYRRAYLAYFDENNLKNARGLTELTRSKQPKQPLYHSLAGLLALKDGDPISAETAFASAIELGHPDPPRVSAFHLWLGRALDLQGRRDEASSRYRKVCASTADRTVERAAVANLRKPYTMRKARNIGIEFSYIDVIDP